jgi:trimethylguanosine synthase
MQGEDSTIPVTTGDNSSDHKKKRNRNRNKQAKSKSRSPTRDGGHGQCRTPDRNNNSPTPAGVANKSRSPTRGGKNLSRSPMRGGNHMPRHHHHHHHLRPPADMTVICKRSDLWDSAAHFLPDETLQTNAHVPDMAVAPYSFLPHCSASKTGPDHSHASAGSVGIARVPHHFEKCDLKVMASGQTNCDVLDTSIPNPHDPEVVHDKYWAQRRRLFTRFDQGIQLDGQGWYSVTPEIIADHVAMRVAELATNHVIPHDAAEGIVILDAFCGCGGNSIAFGKIPSNIISKVVCVDTDRSKLLKAAHNASLYDIPRDKLVFVECNSVFLLKHCYKNGQFILDQPTAQLPPYMPPPVMPTVHAGYHIGGLDMLPRRIDAVFMDPPWGGVDYEILGKNGYDLQKNMKIQVSPPVQAPPEDDYHADGDGCDDFFDSFAAPRRHKSKQLSQKARQENFNKQTDGGHFIDGMELLRVAAEAVTAHVVVYDLPRNTNKMTLGKCALGAGYRGNIKLEEHYLNGRLKTVTAYMGGDYSDLINSLLPPPQTGATSTDEE